MNVHRYAWDVARNGVRKELEPFEQLRLLRRERREGRSVSSRDRTLCKTIDRRVEQSALRLVMRNAVGGERLDGCRRALNGGARGQDERETGERMMGVAKRAR